MTAPPRVFFLNRFYWPDEPATAQLLADLAEGLAAAGHAVSVIASHPGTPSRPLRETRNGVAILRVEGTRLGRRGLLRRCIDFASFLRGAKHLLASEARPGDTVVLLTDPPLLGAFVGGLARRRGLRVIHWVQDIFPEVAFTLKGGRLAGALRPWRDRAWRRADACVTLGTDMAALIAGRGVAPDRLHVSGNWAPQGLAPPPEAGPRALRAAWNLGADLVVAYSGNLGRVHDLDPVLDLAETLRADTDIRFVFIGDGAQRPALERAARARGLANVQFRPAQPRAQLADSLALGDVHLVTLRAGCERLVFPSKLYGIAAVGRPVLVIGPAGCELARLVRARGLGDSFARDDIPRMAAFLRTLRDQPAQRENHARRSLAFGRTEAQFARALAFWDALLRGMPLARANHAPTQ